MNRNSRLKLFKLPLRLLNFTTNILNVVSYSDDPKCVF